MRAFEATQNASFLNRSAAIFDYIASNGWNASTCGGGVTWCPTPDQPYKNAITLELFLSLALALSPYESAVGKPQDFYLNWGLKAWEWLADSGMIGASGLVNDGLNNDCVNNGQTTWTYNQGVMLSGLGAIAAATGNASAAVAAARTANATMGLLTIDGILIEPCGASCDHDQVRPGSNESARERHAIFCPLLLNCSALSVCPLCSAVAVQYIFKGIFARHLSLFAQSYAPFRATAEAFLLAQADSLLAADSCYPGGGYGFRWEGPCDVQNLATFSASLDLLLAAAASSPAPSSAAWQPLALGNCVDAAGASMPNCWTTNVSEMACRDAAWADSASAGYDYETNCLGGSFCRVRTLATSCPSGFSFNAGNATSIAGGNGAQLTLCVVRAH